MDQFLPVFRKPPTPIFDPFLTYLEFAGILGLLAEEVKAEETRARKAEKGEQGKKNGDQEKLQATILS